MGTCYSKNTAGISSENKLSKQKFQDSKRNKKSISKELTLNKNAIKVNGNNCEENVNDCANSGKSRSSTPEIVSDHFKLKHGNIGVVQSDSGIESIDNIEYDTADVALSVQEKDNYPISHEQLRLENSFHSTDPNVGNHSIHFHKTVNSLGNSDHSKPTVTSPSKTNGSQIFTSFSNKFCKKCNPKKHLFPYKSTSTVSSSCTVNNDHNNIDELNHNIERLNHENKSISLSKSTDEISDVFHDDDIDKAPLAAFDSLETNLNDAPSHFIQKRQSLLSEILDITQSLCKCDFYSVEYCNRDHGVSGVVSESNVDISSENGCSEQLNLHNKISTPLSYKNELLQKLNSPSKRVSLSKNVSFITHEEVSNESFMDPEMLVPNTPVISSVTTGNSCNVNDLPPGESINKTTSELVLSKKRKDFHMRSASLGSVRPMMSDSSSDAPATCTEDDMASLDLDSVSRVTSLSYSSIRQLVESTEDLVSRRYTTQSLTVDGMEYVIIPTDSYHQMLLDLATLKQQLMNLSQVMQEIDDLKQ